MIFLKIISNDNLLESNEEPSEEFMVSDRTNLKVSSLQRKWHPLTDVYETDTEFVIRMEIAGMSEGEFTVEADRQMISICGSRQDVMFPRAFYQMEIPFGEFRVVVDLPSIINLNEITADYKDGFIQIHAPKIQPTQIHVHRKDASTS
jgi:HSP20 family protein